MQAELPGQIKFAVKKISPESMQDKLKDELHGEIFFNQMKSLKHDNVIKLFGGYSRKDLHLLIYEHMENGSLHQALFGNLSFKSIFNLTCKIFVFSFSCDMLGNEISWVLDL